MRHRVAGVLTAGVSVVTLLLSDYANRHCIVTG